MRHQMTIELDASEGALLRTLGQVERRGFSLRSCTLREQASSGYMLEIAVESNRPVAVLKRQLERLHDVRMVVLRVAKVAVITPGFQSFAEAQ